MNTVLVALWVKNSNRIVLSTIAPTDVKEVEIDEKIEELCIEAIIDVVYEQCHSTTLSLSEARCEAHRLVEYARRKRKRFWSVASRNQKLSRQHTLENVWKAFHNAKRT